MWRFLINTVCCEFVFKRVAVLDTIVIWQIFSIAKEGAWEFYLENYQHIC